MSRIKVVYVTSNDYKVAENQVFCRVCQLDGSPIIDRFEFDIRRVPIIETLEVDIRAMVRAEVAQAYSHLKVPCIVEHGGLIFCDHLAQSYPGGLTKAMWNALGAGFIDETKSSGRRAVARAVVAFCDGMKVETFVGETEGTLADSPRGSRAFYWDTVFVPDDPSGRTKGKTYAEIVEDPSLGLEYKVKELSQSSRAMLTFLRYRQDNPSCPLWP